MARAAEAFAEPGGIHHFKVQRSNADSPIQAAQVETWHTDDGRRKRMLFAGGGELGMDYDAKFAGAYHPSATRSSGRRTRASESRIRRTSRPRCTCRPRTSRGLARLLEGARNGEGEVRLIGDTTVRGIPVSELHFEFDFARSHIERTIFVDRETSLPGRVVEGQITDDCSEIERLPRTPETGKLVEMGPHPGVKVVLEDL